MQTDGFRDLAAADIPELTDLWQGAWEKAMPQIDFAARREWFAGHLLTLASEGAQVRVLQDEAGLAGFITIHPQTAYIDQLAVAARAWGGGAAPALIAEARRISPLRLELHVNKDNARAARFYAREGFVRVGESISPRTGLPLWTMLWQAPPLS